MKSPLGQLAKQTGFYAVGNIAIKAAGLLLAPFYLNTALLPQESFGQLILLEATAQLCIVIAGFGLRSGLMKYMTDPAYKEKSDSLSFTAFISVLLTAGVLALFFWLTASHIASILLEDRNLATVIRLIAVYILFKTIASIPLILMRIQERAGLFVLATIGELLALIGGVYYFLVVMEMGLEGVLWAFVLSSFLSAFILSSVLLLSVRWRFEIPIIPKLIAFGLPIVFAGLASQVLNVGDRYILQWLTDAETVAVYGWGARIGGVINMLFVQSFHFAFIVIGLKTISADPENVHLYRRTFRHFVIWTGWAVLILTLITYDITNLITDERNYLMAEPLVFLISMGFMSYGIYYIMMNILYARGKSVLIALSVTGAAVFNIGLNIALIPYMGAIGAALATFISYLGLALFTAYNSKHQIEIRYPWRIFILVTVMLFTMYGLSLLSLEWEFVERLFLRGGLIILYPILIVLFRAYNIREIKDGYALIKKQVLGPKDDVVES